MITDPRSAAKAPYPAWTYPARAAWSAVQVSVWRLAWKRITFLRPCLLRAFGADVSLRIQIAGTVKIYFPWWLSMGGDTAIGPGVTFYNLGGISIGERVVISQNAYLCGGTHDYTQPSYPLVRKHLTIADDVWIGASAFVCPGVTIGQGAVVGACAVVSKDVAPWTVVAGNPARVVANRSVSGAEC